MKTLIATVSISGDFAERAAAPSTGRGDLARILLGKMIPLRRDARWAVLPP
jgi:hypothetical protein